MRIRLWIPLATLLLATSSAHSTSLCTAQEVVLFSCETESRIISLCGSIIPNESTNYMQYRYGKPDNVEIAYPKTNKPPIKVFSRHFESWDNGSAELVISFKNGKYIYSVYADLLVGSPDAMNNDRSGEYGHHAGVRVTSNGKLLRDIKCIPYDPAQFDPWAFNEELSPLLPEDSSAPSPQ